MLHGMGFEDTVSIIPAGKFVARTKTKATKK
jgi:hypothetical protein